MLFNDSMGIISTLFSEFNYGATFAKIGLRPNILLSPNGLTYFTEFEGSLYLRVNLPKNLEVSPEGNIEIKAFYSTLMTKEERNTKIRLE